MITMEFLKGRPLSHSSLSAFSVSPAHYMNYINQTRKETAAFALGRAVDCLLLTPDEFEKKFIVKPDFSKGEGIRAKKVAWEIENKGKTWLSQILIDEAQYTADAINANSVSGEMMKRVINTQVKLEWIDEDTKLPMICYVDMQGDTFFSDLKTSKSAHPEEFTRSAYNYGYHRQVAIYQDAFKIARGKILDPYFFVVEKEKPFGVSTLKASSDFMKLGRQEYKNILQSFKFCMENNMFNQTYEFYAPTGVYQLDLPRHGKSKINI